MAAEDPEKKFHSIMDKLFHAPPNPTPTSSNSNVAHLSRGKKRSNPESVLALVEPHKRGKEMKNGAPLCRPWDRGDLMRRASTFKSMTWFAKPKVVSAVNCARKGWINLETDTIGCEVCGARLLFTTPSSWTLQQVEKAALVFSLKLDSGHKLLCPWIDNACDERLAEFPPTIPPVLVEKFRERSVALLQLSAIPVVSSSAIEYMRLRSPQLEEFLRQSPLFECGNQLDGISPAESLGDDNDADSAKFYYQAQKVISLCGWEPRSLPYVVDCKERPNQLVKDAEIVNSCLNGHNIDVHCTPAEESVKAYEDHDAQSALNTDPNSVVLDCRLCGASVGLWTFSTVARPVELFRLTGHAELNSEKNSGQDSDCIERGGVVSSGSNGIQSSTHNQSDFKLTIAGGPPPTKQNFKATISLPVIGQNLRARLSYDSVFRDPRYDKPEDTQSRSEKKNLFQDIDDHAAHDFTQQISQAEGVEQLKSTTYDHGECSYASGVQSSSSNLESKRKGGIEENNIHVSQGDSELVGEDTIPENSTHDSVLECPVSSTLDIVQLSDQSNRLPENKNQNAQNVGFHNSDSGNFGNSQTSISSALDPVTQPETREHIEHAVQVPAHSELVAYGTGKDVKQLSLDKATDFDPILQHRHFCPWIVSTSSGLPGWQQTLSALQRLQDNSHPTINSPAASSMIKVDDPIASVRKLFMSPVSKRMKPTCG